MSVIREVCMINGADFSDPHAFDWTRPYCSNVCECGGVLAVMSRLHTPEGFDPPYREHGYIVRQCETCGRWSRICIGTAMTTVWPDVSEGENHEFWLSMVKLYPLPDIHGWAWDWPMTGRFDDGCAGANDLIEHRRRWHGETWGAYYDETGVFYGAFE